MDAIPVLSQAKSLFQAVWLDLDGARKTQENFSRQCPVVSQVRSACEWAAGDSEAAKETQMQCIGFMSDVVDGIPAVGHVKGVIHYAFGDKEGGDKAMKSSSRTTGVMGGGALGFLVGGPPGAAAGGIVGGLAVDGLTTSIDSAVHKEYRPSGMVFQVTEIVKDPKNPGLWFDTLTIPVFDAVSGVSAGKGAAKIVKKFKAKRLAYNRNKAAIIKKVGKPAYNDISKTAGVARKHMTKRDVKNNVTKVVTRAKDLTTDKSYTGHNLNTRQNLRKTRGQMGGGQAKKDSVFKGNTKSNLQKRVPNARKVLNRDPRSCAEHVALHKVYEDRPSAKPSEIRTCTVQAKKGKITALKRCDNCMQYDPAMGSVPTDKIHGMPILEDPGYPMSKTGAALVVGSVACSAIKQRSKTPRTATEPAKVADKSNCKIKSSSARTNRENEMCTNQKVVTTTIKYEKSKKLHKNAAGKPKAKQYLIVKAAKNRVPRVDSGHTVTDRNSELESIEECTSDFDDENKENIHSTMLIKNLC